MPVMTAILSSFIRLFQITGAADLNTQLPMTILTWGVCRLIVVNKLICSLIN